MTCIEVKPKASAERQLCLDAATGALVREEHPRGQMDGQSEIRAREYSQFLPWAGKTFPRTMRARGANKILVEVRVDEIAPALNPDPSTFAPLAGAEEWPRCENPEPAVVEKQTLPGYPENAKRNRMMGTVSVYAVIGTDGALSHLTVVCSAGPDFDRATLEAVRGWRYRPMTCNAQPLPTETIIDVAYSLAW